MICEKCGCELKDGALFCGNCGAEIGKNENEELLQESPKKKMSIKKKILIGVVSFLVVLAGVGLIWGEEIINKIMFSMPADTQLHAAYYNFSKKLGKSSGALLDQWKQSLDMDAYGTSGTIAIRISDVVKKMMEIEIDEIDRIYFDYEVVQEDYNYGLNLDLGIGNTHVLTANAVVDYGKGTVTMLFPELSETALVADMEYDFGIDMTGIEDYPAQMEEVVEVLKTALPEGALIEKFIPKYMETIIKAIDKVERKDATMEVRGVSQEATALVVNFDEKMVGKISKAIIKQLKKDKEFKSYMRGIYELSLEGESFDKKIWEDEYAEVFDKIEKAILSLKDAEVFKKGVKFVTWIDSDNQIIGIELAETIAWKSAKDGKKVASEYALVESGLQLAKIAVEGTESGDEFSGNIALFVTGQKRLSLEVAKWKNTDDVFACDISLVLDADFMEQATGAEWTVGDITLLLTGEGNKETTGIELAVLLGSNELAALEYSQDSIKEDLHITYPSDTTDFAYVNEWLKEIDVDTLINNLEKAGFSKLDLLGYLYEFGL